MMYTITNFDYYFMFNYLPFGSVVGGHFNYYYFLLFDCTLNTKQHTTIKTNKTLLTNGYYTNDTTEKEYNYETDECDADANEENEEDRVVIDNNNYKTLDKIYYYINTNEV